MRVCVRGCVRGEESVGVRVGERACVIACVCVCARNRVSCRRSNIPFKNISKNEYDSLINIK